MALVSCPECAAKVSTAASACPSCGLPLSSFPTTVRTCPECGWQTRDRDQACGECGYPLAQAAANPAHDANHAKPTASMDDRAAQIERALLDRPRPPPDSSNGSAWTWVGLFVLMMVLGAFAAWQLLRDRSPEFVQSATVPAVQPAQQQPTPSDVLAPPAAPEDMIAEPPPASADQIGSLDAPVDSESDNSPLTREEQGATDEFNPEADSDLDAQDTPDTVTDDDYEAASSADELAQPDPASVSDMPSAPAPTLGEQASIDERYEARRFECPRGFRGSSCRRAIRHELCDGRWTPAPPDGETVCGSRNQ